MIEPVTTARWECPRCQTFRDVPCDHVGDGAPACPTCYLPMQRPGEKLKLRIRGAGKLRSLHDVEKAIASTDGGRDQVIDQALRQLAGQGDPDLAGEQVEDDDI